MPKNDEAEVREVWLRRQALQLVAQLPESPEDAATVLTLAMELVEAYLKPGPAASRVVRLHSIRDPNKNRPQSLDS